MYDIVPCHNEEMIVVNDRQNIDAWKNKKQKSFIM